MKPPPKRVCGVCGAPAPAPFRAPQPESPPDLDMRPGEPARSTLERWIQTCRRCGTSAPDLAALPSAARDIPRSADTPFLRHAQLCEALGDHAGQAEALLQAAWSVDDTSGDDTNEDATALRRRVAELWADATAPETRLRRLDVLRRAGDWDGAEAGLAAQSLDETARAVVAFQRRLIAARDGGRHQISSALPPPAHAPHVTHVQQRRPGLMARLFGRG